MLTLRWIGLSLGMTAGLALLAGCGEKHKDDHAGGHGDGAEAAVKTDFHSYSAAVAAIQEHLEHVEALIEKKDLAELHKAAKPIELIAKTLNKLALKEGSGVPRDKLKEVNLTSKALAKTWAKIDEAGDAGDLDGSKTVCLEMIDLIGTLKKHAKPVEEEHHEEEGHEGEEHGEKPGVSDVAYACPMGCEGDKTYAAAGKCPVCDMDLAKVRGGHSAGGHDDD